MNNLMTSLGSYDPAGPWQDEQPMAPGDYYVYGDWQSDDDSVLIEFSGFVKCKDGILSYTPEDIELRILIAYDDEYQEYSHNRWAVSIAHIIFEKEQTIFKQI